MKRMSQGIQLLIKGGILALAASCGLTSVAAANFEPPNDPHYGKQHYLQQTGVPAAWEAIGAEAQPLHEVIVAVVDTGVDAGHPDLQGRLVPGANILRPADAPQDDNGHGTAVAGVIAAVAGNGVGIAGIAPNVKIMPVKAVGARGIGEEEHLGEGVRHAVDNGADIVVLSLGLHLYSSYMYEIVEYAESKGVLLVAATGNDGKSVRYPAAYPTVLAVGGASFTNEHKPDSNFGPEIDMVAPWFVYTTGSGGTYVYKEGTSMAAPQVAAAAALLLGRQPDLAPAEIRERLRQSTLPIGQGWNDKTGYGLLQTDKAYSNETKADRFEPNDAQAQAKAVPVTAIVNAEFSSAADVDWFAFAPPYPGEVSIRVTDPSGGSIPVELLIGSDAGSSAAAPAAAIDVSNGQETLLPAPDGQRITAGLRLKPGASGAVRYRIETKFRIYSDPYEPNDRAYQSFLLPTRSETVVTGTFSKIDDQDWYAMKFDTQGTISLRLETDSPRIDPELYVVREGQQTGQTYDVNEEGDPEYTGSIAVEPGTYYFRVRNVKSLFPLPVAAEYKLTIAYEKKYFDDFEPNNHSYQATTMVPDRTYRGVFDSAKDEDWFQLRIGRDSLVTMEVTDIPLDRYMYFNLYSSGAQQQYGKRSPFGVSSMQSTHRLAAGVYYIRLMTDAAYQNQQYGVRYTAAPLFAGFTDVEKHWARESIQKLVEKGIVNGYEDYRFLPNASLTRAEAAAIIARAYRLDRPSGVHSFPDVTDSHWAKDAVLSAALKGIIRGYPDGTFRPNDPVTRAEMSIMAAIAAGLPARTGPVAAAFTDLAQDHWAAPYIYAFVESGHLQGFQDGTFRPNGQATRAEFVTLLANLLK